MKKILADTPIIYLLLNATLRKKFFEVIKGYLMKGIKTGKEVVTYASVYPTAFRNRVAAGNFTPTPNQADLTLNQTIFQEKINFFYFFMKNSTTL